MKRRSVLSLTVVLLMTMFGVTPVARAEDPKEAQALLEALGKSKHTLLDGVRQAAKAAPCRSRRNSSSKTASCRCPCIPPGRGFPSHRAERASGAERQPEQGRWEPKVEVFRMCHTFARSSEQLT